MRHMRRALKGLLESGLALLLLPGAVLVWGVEEGYDRFDVVGDIIITVSIISYIIAVLVYAARVDSKEKKKLNRRGPRMRRTAEGGEAPGGED